MTTKTVEMELLNLERQYWRAIQEKNIEAAKRLSDNPCIVTGPQGVSHLDKKALEGLVAAAPWTLNKFEVKDEAEVRLINDDVAILVYKVHETMTVDGKPVTMDANDPSTWVRRGDRWVCALHSESISGDPFGRDRMPAS